MAEPEKTILLISADLEGRVGALSIRELGKFVSDCAPGAMCQTYIQIGSKGMSRFNTDWGFVRYPKYPYIAYSKEALAAEPNTETNDFPDPETCLTEDLDYFLDTYRRQFPNKDLAIVCQHDFIPLVEDVLEHRGLPFKLYDSSSK
jgi:hypothetical protein